MKNFSHRFTPIQLHWMVFAVVTLVIYAFVALRIYDLRVKVILQEQERLQAATTVVESSLLSNLKSINQTLHNIGTSVTMGMGDAALTAQLRTIDQAMPMIQSLIVVDVHGHIQASSQVELQGLARSFSDRDYFRAAQEHPSADTLYVSPPFKSILGVYSVAVSRMLVGPQGEFVGVVAALMDPTYFDTLLMSVLYAPNMVAEVHHGNGTVFLLAPSNRRELIGQSMDGPSSFFAQAASSGVVSNVYSGPMRLTGDARMVAMRDVQLTDLQTNYGLGVAISRPLDDIYAPWRQDVGLLGGVILGLSLTAALALLLYHARLRHFLAAEALSRSRQQRAASVFTHAQEGIFITDSANQIIDVNDAFTAITGYSRDEVLGRGKCVLISGLHDAAFYAAMWHDITTLGYWSGEILNRHKSGAVATHTMSINVVQSDAGVTTHYVALFSDITASKMHQSELERIAHYDTLTGLPNRLLLGKQLRLAIEQSRVSQQMLAVAYLDLDDLKSINDTYGYDTGDAVLVAVSARLRGLLREGDILSRVGGDEFVVVLVGLAQAGDGLAIVEDLLRAAAMPTQLADGIDLPGSGTRPAVHVTASGGVTFFPRDDVETEMLARHAYQAMHLAKQAGKNRYHLFDVAHDAAIHTRQVAIQHMSAALIASEFVLYYQPKFNMRTGTVTGAEALIRWMHPERGLLPPGLFLPAIEGHPFSIAIGEWVIGTALAQMALWHAHGLDMHVSVNIGGLQLQQANFTERLAAQLAAHPGVPPHWLQLEILETSALEDIATVSATMRACQALGVTFALDDFGTGYSSLTYLKHLPAELLKIDQSFVRTMTEQAGDLAIVQGVIGLAHVFQRDVIAEGVETKAHGDLLLSVGCALAQGYGIARPMPAKDLPAWVAQWQETPTWTA